MSKQNYNHQQASNFIPTNLQPYKNTVHLVSMSLHRPYIYNQREKYINQSRNVSKTDDKKYQSLSKTQVGANQKNHEIYFSRTKKYNYMKQIIDKYFDESKKDNLTAKYHTINPQDFLQPKKSISFMPKIIKKQMRDSRGKKESLANMAQHMSMISKRKNKISTINKIKLNEEQDLQNVGSLNFTTNSNKQEFQSNDSILRNISFSSTKNIRNLPPINEQLQEKQQSTINDERYQSLFLLNDSQKLQDYKEEKMTLVENEIYFIQLVSINDRINHKLKTYKEKGEAILNRELKAIKLGIQSIWIQYKFNFKSLITYPNKSLKELLFKIKSQDAEGKSYNIKTKKYHKKLISNNYQELKRVIIDYCEHMKKFQGKILNNKVHLGNLFIGKNENIRLGQWGFSSFRETHLIQQHQFENRIEPIVKSQNEWFVPPQYLAPQILKAIVGNEDIDLMIYQSASDIWSLGIAIFEILTLIPVGAAQKFTVQSKPICRNGILYSKDMKKMLLKEQKLTYLAQKMMQEELKQQKVDIHLVEVILNCLQYCPQNRPTYQQIISILK